jgi:hypothetical protein
MLRGNSAGQETPAGGRKAEYDGPERGSDTLPNRANAAMRQGTNGLRQQKNRALAMAGPTLAQKEEELARGEKALARNMNALAKMEIELAKRKMMMARAEMAIARKGGELGNMKQKLAGIMNTLTTMRARNVASISSPPARDLQGHEQMETQQEALKTRASTGDLGPKSRPEAGKAGRLGLAASQMPPASDARRRAPQAPPTRPEGRDSDPV